VVLPGWRRGANIRPVRPDGGPGHPISRHTSPTAKRTRALGARARRGSVGAAARKAPGSSPNRTWKRSTVSSIAACWVTPTLTPPSRTRPPSPPSVESAATALPRPGRCDPINRSSGELSTALRRDNRQLAVAVVVHRDQTRSREAIGDLVRTRSRYEANAALGAVSRCRPRGARGSLAPWRRRPRCR
jgi:hypothetical protein